MSTARILLVDDHEIMRDGLKLLLEGQPDFAVVGCSFDTNGACRAVAELRPDVVVMDLEIPGGGGIAATERILAADREVKVVVLTGHCEPRFVQAALVAGAHAFLVKSQAGAELVAAIHAALAGKVHLSPEISAIVVQALQRNAGAQRKGLALTARELDILKRIADGQSTKEIAFALVVSPKTVETHRLNLMSKLGVTSVAALTKYAVREGLTAL